MDIKQTKESYRIFLINEKDSITLQINEELNSKITKFICNFSLNEIVKIHKIFYLYNESIEKLFNYLKKIMEQHTLIIQRENINLSFIINYSLDDEEIKIIFKLSKISPNYSNNNCAPIEIMNKSNISFNADIKNTGQENPYISIIERKQTQFENKMNNQIFFNSDPRKLGANFEVTNNCSSARWTLSHSFDIFKSVLDEYLVVYGNNSKNWSIEFYDITTKKVKESLTINNAHKDRICNIKHFYYELKNQDFILSSSVDKSVKLWELYSLKNLLTINHFTEDYFVICEMIFFNRLENDYFIISATSQEIKVWNKKGENINIFNYEPGENSNFLNKFYNKYRCYLLYGSNKIVLRDIESGEIIHKYGEDGDKSYHWAEVSSLFDKKRVIGAHYEDGFIKIHDFNTEKLVKKFSFQKNEHNFSFCLWNEKYIIVGYLYSLKIFNIEDGSLIKEISGFPGWGVLTVFKFFHPSLGDCLVCNSHSGGSDSIGRISLLSIL